MKKYLLLTLAALALQACMNPLAPMDPAHMEMMAKKVQKGR